MITCDTYPVEKHRKLLPNRTREMTEKEYSVSSDRMLLVRADGRVIYPKDSYEWRYVRPDDPITSHEAAEKCLTFKARHISLIWTCLKDNGAMIPAEIARATGLDYHAVQRRIAECIAKGLIERLPETRFGQHVLKAK